MEVNTKNIMKVKNKWPQLTRKGIRWYNKMVKQHSEDFLTEESLARIRHCIYFLRLWKMTKDINYKLNSLDIKRYMEKVTEPNSTMQVGEVILALILAGYKIKITDSPHVFTNIKIPVTKGAKL